MKETVEIKVTDRIHDVAVKEYKGHRVVTFKDIDELHQRPVGTASRNLEKTESILLKGRTISRLHLTKSNPRKFVALALRVQGEE